MACLEKGDIDRICHMVFPPMGTGALLTPVPEFTNIFMDEVLKFSVAHPDTSLTKIKIVMRADRSAKMKVSCILPCPAVWFVSFFLFI